jgi:hypothetical protein
VVNRYLAVGDADIFIGIMGPRFGTPTREAGSGTEEEFDRAYTSHKARGRPRIMFYFSREPVPLPTTEQSVEQLGQVVAFRKRVQQGGLTTDYRDEGEFERLLREHLAAVVAELAVASTTQQSENVQPIPTASLPNIGEQVVGLLSRANSRTAPVAQYISQALALGMQTGDSALIEFCQHELRGWGTESGAASPEEVPEYRTIQAFASATEVNMNYLGWSGDPSRVWQHMRQHPDQFIPVRTAFTEPIGSLEGREVGDPRHAIGRLVTTMRSFNPNASTPDQTVHVYYEADAYRQALEAVRVELTRRLLALFPPAPHSSS